MLLTFLAPATRCNQRCPNCYITEIADEPVDQFDLTPEHYAEFVRRFLAAGIPVRSVKFQGYEVTLPRSWPYLEAVFRLAQVHDVRRSLLTNGMLLSKWTDRLRELDPARISISIDGSSPEVNDRLRGLDGALDATIRSIRAFLRDAPEFQDRLAITSTLRVEDNYASLREMPKLLQQLGIARWVLGVDVGWVGGTIRPLESNERLMPRLAELQALGEEKGIRTFVSDGYGTLPRLTGGPRIHRAPRTEFFYRLDPTGGVQTGRGLFQKWDPEVIPRWKPGDDPLETVGYWNAVDALAAEQAPANRDCYPTVSTALP